jgi:integral membrane sensor domain MASE1
MILALVMLLVVAVVTYIIARFLVTILAGTTGAPAWLPQAIYLLATLIVIFYFVERTLPVLLHSSL